MFINNLKKLIVYLFIFFKPNYVIKLSLWLLILLKNLVMKKQLYILVLLILSTITSSAQIPSAAIVSVYTQGVKISPDMAESLMRIEVTKTGKFNVFDKLDMLEVLAENQIDVSNCFGKKCLTSVGRQSGVDKMITGAIENLGKKIVITVKVLDVKAGNYDKIAIEEFINLDTEVQTMMQITMNKALGIENDPELVNNFVYFNQPPEAPVTYIKNNGPRMGMAFVGGDNGQVLKNPASMGGFDASPIMTQIGYQFEGSYLSAGNFQALIEGLVFLTGLEQNMFNPSLAILNGFRSSRNGWEIGFGPTLRLSRIADGYYMYDDVNNDNWRIESEWRVPANLDTTSPWGGYIDNPYQSYTRMDSRGVVRVQAGWVWALGKTFHSGYLNIPVNAFLSYNKNGYYLGLSMGFNITKKD